jgi:pimeloyl-ACP methyl ester carboxylesterase
MAHAEIIDHPLLSERIFFPRRDAPESFFPVRSGDETLACWYGPLDPEARTVVHFHGNGETVADWVSFLPPIFARMGFNLFLVEYRGYGASSGSPSLGGILDDVPAIVEAIGQPEDRLVAFGRSLGSIGAVELASAHPGIAGLVLESGIAHMPERILLRVEPEEVGLTVEEIVAGACVRLDHQAKLARYEGPKLVLHAEHDSLLDVSNGHRLHEFGGGNRKEIMVFPRGDHNDIMMANFAEYWTKIAEFLDSLG